MLYFTFYTLHSKPLKEALYQLFLFTNIQVFLISSKSNFESITPFNVFSKNTPIMHAIYV